MASLWNRIPIWTDWVVAAVAAIVVYNLNVTTSGDPLSGMELADRPTFYGSLAVGGFMLTAAGLLVMSSRRDRVLGGLVVRTYGGVALAGFLGLLLDYRDGPVSTVRLFAYMMLFLGAVRLARLAALAADDDERHGQAGDDPGLQSFPGHEVTG